MARAYTKLRTLDGFFEKVRAISEELNRVREQLSEVQRAEMQISQEIGSFSSLMNQCKHIVSKLANKINQLKAKETTLSAEIAALRMVALVDREAALEIKDLQEQLRAVRLKREEAETLSEQVENYGSEIKRHIDTLENCRSDLKITEETISTQVISFERECERATNLLSQSHKCIEFYLAVEIGKVKFANQSAAVLRTTCINGEYQGRNFDFKSELEKVEVASQLKAEGAFDKVVQDYQLTVNPEGKVVSNNFGKHIKAKLTFESRTEENMANGTCLSGTNYRSNRKDRALVESELLKQGKSAEEIRDLFANNDLYYSNDGTSVYLIPTALQQIIVKKTLRNGRAECAVRDYLDGGKSRLEAYKKLRENYPLVTFSQKDCFGICYPDFSPYEVFSCKFPPVTRENIANGTCLVGDSAAGSSDFARFKDSMRQAGYSDEQIKNLLKTHTIHHDEDGVTLRLIPRDLHEACRHQGGAEVIRRQRAMV